MANNTNGKTIVAPKAPNHRGYYNQVWSKWQTKQLGPQPTNEQLGIIHGLGARAGKQALANAMALRDCGATMGQIKTASSLYDGNPTPHRNKMADFVEKAGVLEWVPMPPSGEGKVYRTKLTARGREVIKSKGDRPVHVTAALKAMGEPDKAKAAKAPAKSKGPVSLTSRAKSPRKPADAAKPVDGQATAPKPTGNQTPPQARTVLTEQGPKVIGQQSEQPKT